MSTSRTSGIDTDYVLRVLLDAARMIGVAVGALTAQDLPKRGFGHDNQYLLDIAADRAVVPFLLESGLGVHSEETGLHEPDRAVVVVLDPVDGSSNCARGFPWFGPSLCVVDESGPLVAVVANHGVGTTHSAVRGQGAWRDGVVITPSRQENLDGAFVHIDVTHGDLGDRCFVRNVGASAHALCIVADGTLDGYADVEARQSPWDYLAATLVIREAGGVVTGRDDPLNYAVGDSRPRQLIAGATSALHNALIEALRI